MNQHQPPEELPEERRMEIYQALADEQDLYEFTREQAHQRIARRFGVTEARRRQIEQEGRDKLWPPY